jgi:hypothetical protein
LDPSWTAGLSANVLTDRPNNQLAVSELDAADA